MQRLVPTNPQTIDVAEETLGIRHPEFSSGDNTTHASILTSYRSTMPYGLGFVADKKAPLPPAIGGAPSSVSSLASIIFGACLPPRLKGEVFR